MYKFFTVFKFHLKEGLTSKMFISTMIILFTVIIGFFGFTHFVNDDEKLEISVANLSDNYALPQEELNKTADFSNFTEIEDKDIEYQKQQVLNGDLDGVLILNESDDIPTIDYLYKRIPDYQLLALVQNFIQVQYTTHVGIKENIEPLVLKSLMEPVVVKNTPLKTDDTTGLVYFFVYLMFLFIIMFGQMVAMGIAGEKASRVMEIMITKVKPITMMYAKILSTMIMGLIQISVVAIAYLIALFLGWTSGDKLNLLGMPIDLSVLNAKIFLFFVLYFILGYILYALLFASISSAVNRVEDVGSVIFPVTMLLTGAFLLGFKSMMDPNDTLVIIGSYFPFFSPIVTFSRVVLGEASLPEIVGSIGLLVFTILVMSYFANRIYINGVMKYNNKTSIKDVLAMAKRKQ